MMLPMLITWLQVMGFEGLAPEVINSRAAMLGVCLYPAEGGGEHNCLLTNFPQEAPATCFKLMS